MRAIESDIWGKVAPEGRGDGVVGMPIAEVVGPSWPFMLALSSPVMTSVPNGLLRSAADGIGILKARSTGTARDRSVGARKPSTTQASDGAIVPYSELASIGSP
ncbi:hypothetical protein V496_07621 [Pseudogymnoascus sp. VKM F-4515 (FW-2607)]|nr:hypothetical protein V496_07621 [Pseudogymnoascus sp. VKM F-4515 (FW-2607)]KFY93981.1 hypothetical protein V498_04126 [Pseudogymnoascus sp. VKM F-4517 (FW-2822)]